MLCFHFSTTPRILLQQPVPNADYVVPIEIDGQQHHVYVLKRPHVDEFLAALAPLFEVVLFTASLSKYSGRYPASFCCRGSHVSRDLSSLAPCYSAPDASPRIGFTFLPILPTSHLPHSPLLGLSRYADPVTDLLDPQRVMRYRLFREHCVFHRGSYVKDLSRLGRELPTTVIVDNSPASYLFHPDNAIGCISWFDDKNDTELLDMIPFFERMAKVDDVTTLRWNRMATY